MASKVQPTDVPALAGNFLLPAPLGELSHPHCCAQEILKYDFKYLYVSVIILHFKLETGFSHV
jgi:hypothetical protein